MTGISNRTIIEEMARIGIANAMPEAMDEVYILPAKHWLRETLPPAARDMFRKLRADKYIPEQNDCDDFAEKLREFVKQSHLYTGQTQFAILFGMMSYKPDNGPFHRVNFTMSRTESRPIEVHVIEPQYVAKGFDGFFQLSKTEAASCTNFFF